MLPCQDLSHAPQARQLSLSRQANYDAYDYANEHNHSLVIIVLSSPLLF